MNKGTTPYRAGIIGLGRVASLLEKDPLRSHPCTHAGFFSRREDVALVAGCDIKLDRREEFASTWTLAASSVYGNYRDMLASERLDIVSICAYATERLEMCEAAIQAGARALWIEKSLGCSLREANRIMELVAETGVAAVVDYPRRARPAYRAVKRLIDEQRFGKLQTVTCHMNGQLLHTGTHAFDVLRYWGGEAIRACATLEHEPRADMEFQDRGGSGTIEFDSGIVAFISARRKRYYIFQFDLIFEEGRILLGNDIRKVYTPADSRLYSGFRELFETDEVELSDPHREDLLQDLVTSMETGEPPISSVTNAVEALRIGLALFESDRRQAQWVNIREVPEDLRIANL